MKGFLCSAIIVGY
ncbi:hypothetical protein CFP56_043259 [Quercus suber]|uniref:Uncharacterized protein n=1 Tax=Quercus suber TaxID=58331 RepID=A0AAW0IS53_QUESU